MLSCQHSYLRNIRKRQWGSPALPLTKIRVINIFLVFVNQPTASKCVRAPLLQVPLNLVYKPASQRLHTMIRGCYCCYALAMAYMLFVTLPMTQYLLNNRGVGAAAKSAACLCGAGLHWSLYRQEGCIRDCFRVNKHAVQRIASLTMRMCSTVSSKIW